MLYIKMLLYYFLYTLNSFNYYNFKNEATYSALYKCYLYLNHWRNGKYLFCIWFPYGIDRNSDKMLLSVNTWLHPIWGNWFSLISMSYFTRGQRSDVPSPASRVTFKSVKNTSCWWPERLQSWSFLKRTYCKDHPRRKSTLGASLMVDNIYIDPT